MADGQEVVSTMDRAWALLDRASRAREDGNQAKGEDAARSYEEGVWCLRRAQALVALERLEDRYLSEQFDRRWRGLAGALQRNLSLVRLRQGRATEAREAAQQSLEAEECEKGRYRLRKALEAIEEAPGGSAVPGGLSQAFWAISASCLTCLTGRELWSRDAGGQTALHRAAVGGPCFRRPGPSV